MAFFRKIKARFSPIYHDLETQFRRIPPIPRNLMVTALFLCAAYWVSSILIGHTGGENNSALVFVLAVVLTILPLTYITAFLLQKDKIYNPPLELLEKSPDQTKIINLKIANGEDI